jgi:uncharacterized protein YndB with AHSA1/START domain
MDRCVTGNRHPASNTCEEDTVTGSDALVHVREAASEVFALIDDEALAPQWMESCVALASVSSGPKRVGTRLHYTYRKGAQTGAMDGTVTGYEPHRRLAMQYVDPRFAVDVEFELAAEKDGTAVMHRITITPRTLLGRFLAPVIRVGNRRQVSANLRRLKALLERRS